MSDLPRSKSQAVADPLGHRILQVIDMQVACTPREIAGALLESEDKIHFYLRGLEAAGVIARQDGGEGTEQPTYRAQLGPMSWSWSEPVEMAEHVTAKLEAARLNCEDAIYRKARDVERGRSPGVLSVGTPRFATSLEEIEAFHSELLKLVRRFEQRALDREGKPETRNRQWLRLTFAMYSEPVNHAPDDSEVRTGRDAV